MVDDDGVEQLEGAFAGFGDFLGGVSEPGVWAKEGGKGEGHFGGIELFGAFLAGFLGVVDADQRDAEAVEVAAGIQATDFEIGGEDDLIDVAGNPGGVSEGDAEDLFAAVDVQGDSAVGGDLAFGLGGADQAVEAAVVEVAGEAEARVGGLAAFFEVGVEEEVVSVGDGIDEAVDGGGFSPAVEAFSLDPGEFGEGVYDFGVGVGAGDFFEGGDGAVDVFAIAAFDVEAFESFERSGAGTVEPGEGALEGGVGAVASGGLDGQVLPSQNSGDDDRELRQNHGWATPLTPSEMGIAVREDLIPFGEAIIRMGEEWSMPTSANGFWRKGNGLMEGWRSEEERRPSADDTDGCRFKKGFGQKN